MANDLSDELLQAPKYVQCILGHSMANKCRDGGSAVLERTVSSYSPLHSFELSQGSLKGYKQQYADMYFLRLTMLKPFVEDLATRAWSEFQVQILRSNVDNYRD